MAEIVDMVHNHAATNKLGHQSANAAYYGLLALLWWHRSRRVLEVRDRGIVHGFQFISWLNIERYEWEPSQRRGERVIAVLRLHVVRRFSFLPSPRIRIFEGKAELEAILKRHLSTWPE